jgi:predicted regulator of Ras-like GTPase activity (Roadblock/LC7/MglB family)
VSDRFGEALDRITRVGGVLGALLVSAEDGLIVSDALMEGVRGPAVAALAASLARRCGLVAGAADVGVIRFLHLQGTDGILTIVPAREGTLLVSVGSSEMNVGLARLEMLRAVEVAP